MTAGMAILIVMVGFLIVLFLGYPLSFALGGLGVIFGITMWSNPGVVNLFIRSVLNVCNNTSYVSMILFILMGCILERSGASDDMFETIRVIFGRMRGGIAIGVIVLCTLLGAATGIIGASISMMTLLALPAMMKYKYNKPLTYGVIMSAGCLGTIIPPSIILVIYGAQAQISIGKLFAGGLGAGLLLSFLYLIYVVVMNILHKDWGPAITQEELSVYTSAMKAKLVVKSLLPTAILIFLVLGSIMLGVATPTEAAALGVVGSAAIALMYGKFNWKMLQESLYNTFLTHTMIMWIIMAASLFTAVFLGLGGNQVINDFLVSLDVNRWMLFSVICVIVVIMGMFIDSYGVLLIGIPIFTPVVYALGFDPLWFAIIFAVLIQMSYLSPPFAYAAFYVKGVAKENIPIGEIYMASIPFLLLQVVAIIILCMLPEIITWLPSHIM
ncbi:MAG: TRAP transporter large permease subunit [Gracilibacteraceae bacterium]|jgi:tripartite ATP-independent transporter DctM subunit|nr:TRAP transporter large permease subunit [Gracilibacteraceae bacterium]